MTNSITLFKQFVPLLDEVYKEASKTAVLDGRPELVQAGANANELVIPKMTMDGLADYSRNGGYVGGGMSLTNETVTCNFDRGRMFVVDHMDNADTAGVAFGMLAGEFIRTKVVPELDAFRVATYAGAAGIGSGSGTLNDGAAVVAALRAAINAMDADEVPMEDRVLFITSSLPHQHGIPMAGVFRHRPGGDAGRGFAAGFGGFADLVPAGADCGSHHGGHGGQCEGLGV